MTCHLQRRVSAYEQVEFFLAFCSLFMIEEAFSEAVVLLIPFAMKQYVFLPISCFKMSNDKAYLIITYGVIVDSLLYFLKPIAF